MMAVLNRPLTEGEVRKMLADWRRDWPKIPTFYDMLQDALENPTPHQVVYDGTKITHVPPTSFLWEAERKKPNYCVWIVPGTHERKTR